VQAANCCLLIPAYSGGVSCVSDVGGDFSQTRPGEFGASWCDRGIQVKCRTTVLNKLHDAIAAVNTVVLPP